jgi:peptidyl-prolyl cis-trans isomerase D
MLQLIRDYASGWFAIVIIAMITIPFTMWGVHQYSGDTPANLAATVNGAPIEERDLNNAIQIQTQHMRNLLGANYNPALIDRALIRQEALKNLINSELVRQAIADYGMRISDADLVARIHSMPAFQTDGKFDTGRYREQLQYQGYSPAKYEWDYRTSLLQQQLQETVDGATPVSGYDVDNLYRLRHQQRDVGYFTLQLEKFVSDTEVSEIDVKNRYDSQPDIYMSPEQVKVDYIELSVDALAAAVAVDENTLRQEYEQHAGSYTEPEQRQASHILIQVAEDAGEAAVKAAQEKIAGIEKRIREGGDFAALAKEFSDDTASAAQGGDLGMFGKGAMVPEVEQAVFSMKQGEISAPVRTQFGFHLIRLTAIQPAQGKSFAEVRTELETNYRKRQAEERYYQQADMLTDLAYEHADSLEPAAGALDLSIQHSDWVTQAGGEGVFANPMVTAAAFSPEVLAGNNSDTIEIDSDHILVLRVVEHALPARLPFEDVRELIATQMRREKAETLIAQIGEALLGRARAGESPQVLATEHRVEFKRIEALTRDSADVPPAVAARAFTLPAPAAGDKPLYHGMSMQSGDYLILALYGVRHGDPAAMSAEDKTALRRDLARMYGGFVMYAMVENLRNQAKITIREKTETPE